MSGWMAFCPSELTWSPGHSCPTSSTTLLSGPPSQGLPLAKTNKVYSKGSNGLIPVFGQQGRWQEWVREVKGNR